VAAKDVTGKRELGGESKNKKDDRKKLNIQTSHKAGNLLVKPAKQPRASSWLNKYQQ